MVRALTLAALLATATIFACEVSTPGVGSAAPEDDTCLDAAAPGDSVDGAAPNGVAAADAAAGGDQAEGGAPVGADATVGPGAVCATGVQGQ
jgi:hypothetical protein